MKTKQMKVLNDFFNNCINDTVEMIINNINDHREARENLQGGEFDSYIPNVKEFRNNVTHTHSYTKGTILYTYILKPLDEANEDVIDMMNRMNKAESIKSDIVNRYPKNFLDVALSYRVNEEAIRKVVSKYFNEKKQSLIDTVAKKGGVVNDARYLTVNMGILNGLLECEKGLVKIETIFAGGYNIQCLHIRTLVKLLK